MSLEQDKLGNWILQILHNDYSKNRYLPLSSIALLLEFSNEEISRGLERLTKAGLIESSDSGYRLSEQGYNLTFQRQTSFCPHL